MDIKFEILKVLRNSKLATYTDLFHIQNASPTEVRAVLKTLVEDGLVDDRRHSQGPFSLTDRGMSVLLSLQHEADDLNKIMNDVAQARADQARNEERNGHRTLTIAICTILVTILAALIPYIELLFH